MINYKSHRDSVVPLSYLSSNDPSRSDISSSYTSSNRQNSAVHVATLDFYRYVEVNEVVQLELEGSSGILGEVGYSNSS